MIIKKVDLEDDELELKEIADIINSDEKLEKKQIITFDKVLSTGSTLLDLSVSGNKRRGGGIPGGIVAEIFGPSGAGKTGILSETAGSAQYNKGEALFLDPEARLDQTYAKKYGLELTEENYERPDTVREMFELIWNWEPKNKDNINLVAADSLAALSTEMEMGDQDKMGMKRAKDFSEGFRKTARIIANNNWLILCSNQERDGTNGITTPGGKAIPYYSSLRIRVFPEFTGNKIKKSKKIGSKSIDKIIGIRSRCQIRKSTIDMPFRECNISFIFNVGIDDVRENLRYIKEIQGMKKYDCIDAEYATIDKAIEYIETKNLENDLREKTIDLWEEVEEKFRIERKPKTRR